MERLSIRQLEEKDLDFAYGMTVRERWNVTMDDVKRMFSYEPNGNFIAEVEGSSADHVFTVSYGELGWIGLLIVKAEYRKKGVATLLTKEAIDYLLDRDVKTIRLEDRSIDQTDRILFHNDFITWETNDMPNI